MKIHVTVFWVVTPCSDVEDHPGGSKVLGYVGVLLIEYLANHRFQRNLMKTMYG